MTLLELLVTRVDNGAATVGGLDLPVLDLVVLLVLPDSCNGEADASSI